VRFYIFFFENDKTDLRQLFFQGLGENTCSLQLVKKQCTRPYRPYAPTWIKVDPGSTSFRSRKLL